MENQPSIEVKQAEIDLGDANAEIKKRYNYHCGLENLKLRTDGLGFRAFFNSPDGQNGELYQELRKLKYRDAGYSAEYFWKVRKNLDNGQNVFIAYAEGDISIYQK